MFPVVKGPCSSSALTSCTWWLNPRLTSGRWYVVYIPAEGDLLHIQANHGTGEHGMPWLHLANNKEIWSAQRLAHGVPWYLQFTGINEPCEHRNAGIHRSMKMSFTNRKRRTTTTMMMTSVIWRYVIFSGNDTRGRFLLIWFNFNPSLNLSHGSQTATVQPLKFGNG